MAKNSAVTLGRYCMVTVDSGQDLEMYVLVCKLTKYLYYRQQPYDSLENGLER